MLLPSGGDDHTVKVWDLRQRTSVYTIPAHTSLISTVRWQPGSGHTLLTAGFDRQVRGETVTCEVWVCKQAPHASLERILVPWVILMCGVRQAFAAAILGVHLLLKRGG